MKLDDCDIRLVEGCESIIQPGLSFFLQTGRAMHLSRRTPKPRMSLKLKATGGALTWKAGLKTVGLSCFAKGQATTSNID